MNTQSTFLICAVALAALPVHADTLPEWAATNPTGAPVRMAVPAPRDPRSTHLAWPKVVRTTKGTLVLATCAGQGHNTGSSGPAISRSTNGGASFDEPRVLMRFPDDDPRYKDCGNIALGVAGDGGLVLLAMAFDRDEGNNILGWRSTDDGVTWARVDTSALGPDKTGSVFGRIVTVEGRGLVALGHYRAGSRPYTKGIWMSESHDNGITWGEARRIADVDAVEPVLVPTRDRLVGFFRGESKILRGREFVGVSDDRGETWHTELSNLDAENRETARLAAPCAAEDPDHPGQLLVLTTERAVPGNTPGRIWLWRGDVKSLAWKRERVVLEIPHVEGDRNTDFGYPWLLHVEGDRWLMFYYHGNARGACSIWSTEFRP